ncbi:MAG: HAMP domain-containing histidine kinase [Duncaniella sp.]|nr:HAMP domain-containing histidine kinase [Duncaniella sp.]
MFSLNNRLSYHGRLFLWLLGYSWLLVGCFVAFQYHREKEYKAEELDVRLQLINTYLLSELSENHRIPTEKLAGLQPFSDLRVSIIDNHGNVIYDNTLDSLPSSNHIGRKEISDAIKTGSGYTVRRHSESTGKTYFYSARRGDNGYIVRSAVPYTVPLSDILEADYGFLWVMGIMSIVMCIIGYFATRHVGIHEQKEKERLRKQLTNNINHELKTPVASIQACIETLLAHPTLSETKRMEFLQRSLTNTERLKRLLADVSLITRMDDGSDAIIREHFNLTDTIREVVADSEPIAKAKGMRITMTMQDDTEMTGNSSLMASVFRNLIDNAIAYSGGTLIEIRQTETNADRTVITVIDNGVGIPPEHLPRIFERFYRIDKGRSRAAGGTGLGLSIVKNAILLHSGTITVENLPHSGLMFRIMIPLH